jgi:tetratricopeptide (TPR) repeat protein
MKKFLFILLFLNTFNISATEWESYWIAAVEDCHHKDYISAEQNFNMAIEFMENENDLEHPFVYLDRAHLYMSWDKYENALLDLNKAIHSEKLNVKERVKAVISRITAKKNLGFSDGYEEDLEFLVKNFEIQFENTENYVLIRNMPKEKTRRESIIHSFINSGICRNEDDVKMLSSDIYIVNKHVGLNMQLIEACKRWCDASAVAAIAWCANYPELRLIKACNSAVFEIQNDCRTCCQNGYSQDICAFPFGNIVAVMQKYLKAPCGCN